MQKQNKKGFTLIELLIVIAIIGILASVVLVSLSGARSKSQNAAIMAIVDSIGKAIGACVVAGGTPNSPNHATAPTNAICDLGNTYGMYPALPGGVSWDAGYLGGNAENGYVVRSVTTVGIKRVYAGTYNGPSWLVACGTANTGQCRLTTTYGGMLSDPNVEGGAWK